MPNGLSNLIRLIKEPEILISVAGICVASILAYFGIKDSNTQQALNAILTLLGTLSVVQLISSAESLKTRKLVEHIKNDIRSASHDSGPPLKLRADIVSLQERAKDAKDILIIAKTAVIVMRQTEFFVERLRKGTTIRLAVANPENAELMEILGNQPDMGKDAILADLQGLAAMVRRINSKTDNSGRIIIRVFNHIPTMSLVMIDGILATGQINVEILPYKVSPYLRPCLNITVKENPIWYGYFHERCESIWQESNEASKYFSPSK